MSAAAQRTLSMFLSYSRQNKDFVDRLVLNLRSAIGNTDAVWYDIYGLEAGADWIGTIGREIEARPVFIVVLSPDSVDSYWVNEEIKIALNERKIIVPILYQPCKPPAFLRTRQSVSFLPPKSYDSCFRELMKAIERIARDLNPDAAPESTALPSRPVAPAASPSPQPAPASSTAGTYAPPLPARAVPRASKPIGAGGVIPTLTRSLLAVLTAAVVVAGLGFALNRLASLRGGAGPSATLTPTPIRGGSIVDALYAEPDTLLPYLTYYTFAVMVDQAIWAPLWYGDPSGSFHTGIAQNVPAPSNGISPDLKTFTVRLRSGLKWSDGTPETADDCVTTFNLMGNPAAVNTLGFPTTDPADPIGFVGATKVDTQTFTLTFRNPFVAFTAALADGAATCLPKSIFASVSPADLAKSSQNFQPTVTNGPFKIQDRAAKDHITVVRNPNYYQGPEKPYLDQINFKIMTDQNTILAGFQAHTLDTSWFLDPTKLDSYKALSGYTTYQDGGAGYDWLIFNLSDPILSDLKVRQALTMSIDPQNEIYQAIYHGSAKATCDDHAGTFAHESSLVPCYKYDPAAARTLLDGDGWTIGSDNYRHKGGQTLELAYTTTAKAARIQTQQIFQQDWKNIGIKVDLQNLPAQTFFGNSGTLCKGTFQIGEFAYTNGYDPDDHTLFSSDQTCDKGGSNYGHYSNPEVDQQERVQQATADPTARKAAFHIIHQDVIKDLPGYYLFTASNISVYNTKLRNYQPSAVGASETWNVWDWWLSR